MRALFSCVIVAMAISIVAQAQIRFSEKEDGPMIIIEGNGRPIFDWKAIEKCAARSMPDDYLDRQSWFMCKVAWEARNACALTN